MGRACECREVKDNFSLYYEGPGDLIHVSLFVTYILPAKPFCKHEKYFYIIKKEAIK